VSGGIRIGMRYCAISDRRGMSYRARRGMVQELCDVVRETDCAGDRLRGREGKRQRYGAGAMKCRAIESSSSPCANSKYAVSHSHTVATAVCSPYYSYYSGNIPRYMQY